MKLPPIFGFVLLMWFVLASSLAIFGQEEPGKDGKYRDPDTGEVQPATCDNSFKNEHPCKCANADQTCKGVGEHCQTFCRPKACRCASGCTS